MLVDPGVAVTLEPVVKFNPVAGDQVKVFAPEAVKVLELPAQTVVFELARVGVGSTWSMDVLVTLQPNEVPVIV